MRIGIDTSVLIGLLDDKDLWHQPAVALQETMVEQGVEIIMFDCVLAEAISTLARRVHEKRRKTDLAVILQTLQSIYPLDDVEWLFPVVPALYRDIVEMVRSSSGELNFNDALIALSCRHRNISRLASFDRDFDSVSWLTRVVEPEDIV